MCRLEGSKGNRIGFSSQLHLLVDALEMSFEAQFMEDFVSGSNILVWYLSMIFAGFRFLLGNAIRFW